MKNRKTKIIFLNIRHYYGNNVPLYTDEKLDMFYLFGMGAQLGKELLKRSRDILIENWRLDRSVTKDLIRTVDGIVCRVFMSKSIFRVEYSSELLIQIKKESEDYHVIIHFMGLHSYSYYLIAFANRSCPRFWTHLGGGNPYYKSKLARNFRKKIQIRFEKFLYNESDFFFTISKHEVAYLQSIVKNENRVKYGPVFGVNFDVFDITKKVEAKKLLGISTEKKLILQVGRAEKNRGVDVLIQLYDRLSKDYNVLLVDTLPDHTLYEEIVEKEIPFTGPKFGRELALYYSAADVLVYLPFGDEDLKFAGTSYVPLEALACGTPVVATTFISFPGVEVDQIARVPSSPADVFPMILELLQFPPNPQRCREIVKKHFDWDKILDLYLTVVKQTYR